MGSSKKEKKMFRVSLVFVLISITAFIYSGSALDCLVCSEGPVGMESQCGENENGTSTTCPEGHLCVRAECVTPSQGQFLMLACSDNANAPDEFCDDVGTDEGNLCHVCTCSSDNCNGQKINGTTEA